MVIGQLIAARGCRLAASKLSGGARVACSNFSASIEKNLKDVILVGHSYGGMVITGVADQVPNRIRRLVYWNAFVPNNGESLYDMLPPPYVTLFEQKFSGFAVSNLAQGFHQ